MRRPNADKTTKMISRFFHPQSPKRPSLTDSVKSQNNTKELKIEIDQLRDELKRER